MSECQVAKADTGVGESLIDERHELAGENTHETHTEASRVVDDPDVQSIRARGSQKPEIRVCLGHQRVPVELVDLADLQRTCLPSIGSGTLVLQRETNVEDRIAPFSTPDMELFEQPVEGVKCVREGFQARIAYARQQGIETVDATHRGPKSDRVHIGADSRLELRQGASSDRGSYDQLLLARV